MAEQIKLAGEKGVAKQSAAAGEKNVATAAEGAPAAVPAGAHAPAGEKSDAVAADAPAGEKHSESGAAGAAAPADVAAALASGALTTADLPCAPVGKRCRRVLALDDAALSAAIHTDRALDPMTFLPDMDVLDNGRFDRVLDAAEAYDPAAVTAADVLRVLAQDTLEPADFAVLLAPAAEPFLEQMAERAQRERVRWFGTNMQFFTPLYIANYCENRCVYCGFNCESGIRRAQLNEDEIIAELDAIAATGQEEILLLTGEDPVRSSVDYIARACALAAERFRTVGVEVYPANVADYAQLRAAGVDYVTVFQETYDPARYAKLHLRGRKRIMPYRFDAQERALRGGMRGVAFAPLLGLADFRRDALACGLHAWELQRAYPHAEISFSCPRMRPAAGAVTPNGPHVTERQLLQVICAYRIFMPFAGVTVSSRESARFRDHVAAITATKVSAGVSTGVGEHTHQADEGDDQFEIADNRDLATMCAAMRAQGLEPVMNDHVLV